MNESEIIWSIKRDSVAHLIASGKRADARKFDEMRKIEIIPGFAERAEGSCLVKLGDTQVLVGVKLDVGEPYPDQPNSGVLISGAELSPLASPDFRSGPPDQESIEVARVVDRGIRESKMIDFDKLCIEEGEKVWSVLIDVHLLDYAGNMFDAATIAAVKALLEAKMPKYEDEKVIRNEFKGKLPINDTVVSNTFVKIAGKNLLDPSLEEEKTLDARLTMSLNSKDEFCAMQKGGYESYTKKDLDELYDIAAKNSKEIRKLYK